MKPGRWMGWAVAVVIPLWAACSRDVGECWLPSEDGEGGGAGGPVVPAGAGGYGDTPPGGTHEAGDVPCPDQEPTPLAEYSCAPSNWGANCLGLCLSYGAICYAAVENNITNRQNVLSKCCNCNPGKCWYTDRTDPKSGCVSAAGPKSKPLCW